MAAPTQASAPKIAVVVTSSCGDVGLQLHVGGAVLGAAEAAEQRGPVVDGDLLGRAGRRARSGGGAGRRAPATPGRRGIRRAEVASRVTPRGWVWAYSVQPRSRAASEIVVLLATPSSPMAIAISPRCSTARRIDACSGAVSLFRSRTRRQSWRRMPPLRWLGPYISTIARASVTTRGAGDVVVESPPTAAADRARRAAPPSAAVTANPRRASARTAPSSGTSSAGVPTTSTVSAPTNQPTASPSSERAGTTALTTR